MVAYASGMATLLERTCITAEGPDAAALLQSLLSNDVDTAAPGGGVYALLLTPKARVISDLELYNVHDAYVLACPAGRAELVQQAVLRARFRRKVELAASRHVVVWGGDAGGALARLDTPAGPLHLLAERPSHLDPPEAWEVARIEAGIPVFGREFDEGSMPAEAGLVERAVSFTKGCYPGQEPVARLHYRGHANRGLRGLELSAPLSQPAAVVTGDREVGRASSPVVSPRFGPISLAVLRREVEDGEAVEVGGVSGRVRSLPFAA
jgi:folate-binding protein YgfZ